MLAGMKLTLVGCFDERDGKCMWGKVPLSKR